MNTSPRKQPPFRQRWLVFNFRNGTTSGEGGMLNCLSRSVSYSLIHKEKPKDYAEINRKQAEWQQQLKPEIVLVFPFRVSAGRERARSLALVKYFFSIFEYTSVVAQAQPRNNTNINHDGIPRYRNLIIRNGGITPKTIRKIASNGIYHL